MQCSDMLLMDVKGCWCNMSNSVGIHVRYLCGPILFGNAVDVVETLEVEKCNIILLRHQRNIDNAHTELLEGKEYKLTLRNACKKTLVGFTLMQTLLELVKCERLLKP